MRQSILSGSGSAGGKQYYNEDLSPLLMADGLASLFFSSGELMDELMLKSPSFCYLNSAIYGSGSHCSFKGEMMSFGSDSFIDFKFVNILQLNGVLIRL